MAIDVYSQCPGATGKKIKFCCSDFISELEKIDRMIEGEQFAACLQHIDRLREQPENHDRQCLLAYQAMLLRATGQVQAAQTHAAYFLEKYPTNQLALAEAAMLAAGRDDAAAMNFLQRAFAQAKGSWSWRTYQAAEILTEVYLHQGRWLPARSLLQFLLLVDKKNENVLQMLTELFRSPEIPLLLKEDPRFPSPPKNAAWKDRYAKALESTTYGDWLGTEQNLTALASEAPDSPAIWRSLATLRGWLADASGCIAALRKYAALDIPLEDAVEAEATAMLLTKNHLGDAVAILNVTWTVKDADRVQESLLSDERIKPIAFDPVELASEDSPPPKAAFILFDRAVVESLEGLTAQSMPRFLGQLLLFGRQTDRQSKLKLVGLNANQLAIVKNIIRSVAGEWLDAEEKTDEIASASATEDLLQPHWRPPQALKPQQFRTMLDEYRRNALLNRWPDLKLGVLDGQSPREAAADPRLKITLLATILLLQHYADLIRWTIDLDELRAKLGLPILESIDPEPGNVSLVPLVRLARLKVDKLSDEELVQVFQRAVGYNHRAVVLKFGAELIARPSFQGRKEQLLAYLSLAHIEDDLDRPLQYIQAGRQATDALGKPHAMWDLEELSLRFARREVPEAIDLIRHIESTHINEPNVSTLLTQILINEGLLRPDGSLPSRPGSKEDEMAAVGTPSAEPGKLWTPDEESSGGGGKLWIPD